MSVGRDATRDTGKDAGKDADAPLEAAPSSRVEQGLWRTERTG